MKLYINAQQYNWEIYLGKYFFVKPYHTKIFVDFIYILVNAMLTPKGLDMSFLTNMLNKTYSSTKQNLIGKNETDLEKSVCLIVSKLWKLY